MIDSFTRYCERHGARCTFKGEFVRDEYHNRADGLTWAQLRPGRAAVDNGTTDDYGYEGVRLYHKVVHA